MKRKDSPMSLEERLDALFQEIGALREDVSGLREDVSGLREHVSGLREHVRATRLLAARTEALGDLAEQRRAVMPVIGGVSETHFKNPLIMRWDDDMVCAHRGLVIVRKYEAMPFSPLHLPAPLHLVTRSATIRIPMTSFVPAGFLDDDECERSCAAWVLSVSAVFRGPEFFRHAVQSRITKARASFAGFSRTTPSAAPSPQKTKIRLPRASFTSSTRLPRRTTSPCASAEPTLRRRRYSGS
jgi:hypothetical protein